MSFAGDVANGDGHQEKRGYKRRRLQSIRYGRNSIQVGNAEA